MVDLVFALVVTGYYLDDLLRQCHSSTALNSNLVEKRIGFDHVVVLVVVVVVEIYVDSDFEILRCDFG